MVQSWQLLLGLGLSIGVVFGLLFFKLGSLTGGVSASETGFSSQPNLHAILQNPLNAQYNLLLLGLHKIGYTNAAAIRSISAVMGLLCILCFFIILKKWQTTRMAILGTVLFAASSWFLHTARFGSPDVYMFGLVVLLACGIWLRSGSHKFLAFLVTAVVAASLFYVPGLVWFVVAAIIWQRKLLFGVLKQTSKIWMVVCILLAIGALAPLVLAFVDSPSLLKPWLGAPTHWPTIKQIALNVLHVPEYLFVRGPNNPSLWLGKLPILDIFTTVMFALGAYAYYLRRKLDQGRLLLGILIIGTVLIALGGPVTITVLVPFVYMVIPAGIALMLQQWFTVFPRNPLARSVGTALLSMAVLFAAFYHINHYFIAWPNAPETRQAFSIRK